VLLYNLLFIGELSPEAEIPPSKAESQRCVRIMTAARFKGIFALEYEEGPWDGVEGSRYLLKEVLAAL